MLVTIHNVTLENLIFFILISLAVLISMGRRRDSGELMPVSVTQELKGLAILLVAWAHIGLYLVTDTKFLAPLSYFAGVGVDIFLFLSGFGLAISSIEKGLKRKQFYIKRILKIFIPLWLVLGLLVFLDYIIHHTVYSVTALKYAAIGFFPQANLYGDINSPLWYFSLIIFYYLLFPLVWLKKAPYVSAIALFGVSYFLVTQVKLPVTIGVLGLYKLHLLAFPLGMIGAWVVSLCGNLFKNKLEKLSILPKAKLFLTMLRWLLIASLVMFIYHNGIHSGVGKGARVEQMIGLCTTAAVILVFMVKTTRFKLLQTVGVYSYEIYLLHWPLLYRFDLLYKILPPALATFTYIFVFIGLGMALRRVSGWLEKRILRSRNTLAPAEPAAK